MAIKVTGSWRSGFRADADHSFQDDPDQLIVVVGKVIGMPGTVIAIARNVFRRGRVALDITRGKLFLRLDFHRRDSVPTRRLSMRKIKEVLRLRFELGLGQRAIARACSISQSTVHEYLKRAEAAKVPWPLPEGWDQERVETALFGEHRFIEQFPERVLPNFSSLHQQLQQHPHLTLQLAWEEYRQVHPEGYGYSRFCELYGRWRKKQDVVLRQEHQPGEKGFVNWAGRTIPIQDPQTGEVCVAALFVMVLGASNYTYAEATLDQQMAAWLGCHVHAFEYFGGVPRLLVPDNTRTGVSRACRYDPDLNPTYQEMAMHYGIGVVPARPYRPRDKAKAEAGVLVAERWIIAALRH